MGDELIAVLQVMQTKGIGPRSLARLLDRLEHDNLSLCDFVDLQAEEIAAQFGLTQEQAVSLRANDETAARIAQLLEEHGVRMLLRNSRSYPARLQTVLADKTPPVLFTGGSPDLLQQRSVGFCGARDASAESLHSAEQLARALAKQGWLVVSGHAQGADEAAHRAALEAGGNTAFILAEGILQFRPRPSLAGFLALDQFVVVSEFPPKLPWSVASAMQRNRTICGLVQALIVLEAGTSGGTWEAGLEALKLGVPLFVLDFTSPAPSAQGNPLLVKKGGVPLPCQPGELPDFRLLQEALESIKPEAQERLLF